MAWMAWRGIQGGTSYGETDEIGYKHVKDRVSVHDLHATSFISCGMDHKKLTYFHNGPALSPPRRGRGHRKRYWFMAVARALARVSVARFAPAGRRATMG